MQPRDCLTSRFLNPGFAVPFKASSPQFIVNALFQLIGRIGVIDGFDSFGRDLIARKVRIVAAHLSSLVVENERAICERRIKEFVAVRLASMHPEEKGRDSNQRT